MYLKSTLVSKFPSNLLRQIVYWSYNVLFRTKTTDKILNEILLLFGFCMEFNFKQHPVKLIIFTGKILCFGCLIYSDGIRFEPNRIDGIIEIEPPIDGSQLQ